MAVERGGVSAINASCVPSGESAGNVVATVWRNRVPGGGITEKLYDLRWRRGRRRRTKHAPEPHYADDDSRQNRCGHEAPWPLGVPARRRRACGMLARLEGDSRVADVAQAVERILRQAPLEELHHPRRGRRGQRRPVRLSGQDARNGVGHRLTGECAAAREQLVDDATEGPDVCPLVRGLPASLLRAHVGGGSQNQAGAQAITGEGDIGGAVDAHRASCLGEAEVEHLDLPPGAILMFAGFRSRCTIPRS